MESLKALKEALRDRTVAYHPLLADLCGSVTTVLLLSQLLYWAPRGWDREGWIYKTEANLQEETGLTKRNQETARKKLVGLGVLEIKRRGVPAKLHYRLDLDRLVELVEQCAKRTTGPVVNAQQECTKGHNQFGGKRTTRSAETAEVLMESETTKEINPEITEEITGEAEPPFPAPNESRSATKANTDALVIQVMENLESIRGYESGRYPAEAMAVMNMLGQAYSPTDILNCYQSLKKKAFWEGKFLAMTTLSGQIGEWKAKQGRVRSRPDDDRSKYRDEYLRRWGPATLAEANGVANRSPRTLTTDF